MPSKILSVIESRKSVAGASGLLPVAEYMRMSTDQQRYSIEYQCGVIRKYAVQHSMSVVRTYLDDGKSGLKLAGRLGLKALLHDIQNKRADYAAVLVYDVSRWGRFQDPDESAYYEYLCKLAGVRVIYCAEPFDESPMGGLFKNIKRVMAGEYSRNLSVRIWGAQAQGVNNGHRMGGEAGYGLRRLIVGADGKRKAILNTGEWKAISSDYIVLVPGPREEVEVIWRIYDSYALSGMSTREIASDLNAENIGSIRWTPYRVLSVLSSQKYAGDNVYNRASRKLGGKMSPNPEDRWVRHDRCFDALVSPEYFSYVSDLRRIRKARRRLDDHALIRTLRELLREKGHLSSELIIRKRGMPTIGTYIDRFGSMVAAFEAAGYCPLYRKYTGLWRKEEIRWRGELARNLADRIRAKGISAECHEHMKSMVVGTDITVAIFFLRCHMLQGQRRWHIWKLLHSEAQMNLVVRLDHLNQNVYDYHAIPAEALPLLPKRTVGVGTKALRQFRIETPWDVVDHLGSTRRGEVESLERATRVRQDDGSSEDNQNCA